MYFVKQLPVPEHCKATHPGPLVGQGQETQPKLSHAFPTPHGTEVRKGAAPEFVTACDGAASLNTVGAPSSSPCPKALRCCQGELPC